MRFGFEHSYAALPAGFYVGTAPAHVPDPRLVVFNSPLAASLGLAPATILPQAAAIFSGNSLPDDALPLAMAYAGHQFGQFNPQLGDGRAILLGELRADDGLLRDVQLKGAGRTPFSRGGDGRAALGPMLREYLISEAMHGFGIPTTRSLAVVATGESVRRETLLPGAVLTRVASSHVRVGTFQYFAARGDDASVRQLLDYVIGRHYPQARDALNPALTVLQLVAERQAALVASWMLVGFIHGVMNTDNMAISGETIDYGPCAFLDRYAPDTSFSSIDQRGRYAFANQPAIAQWNLARLAETLLPLLHASTDEAVSLATVVVEGFRERFDACFLAGLRRKTGLLTPATDDAPFLDRLLAAMHEGEADFTRVFRSLCSAAADSGATADVLQLFGPGCPIEPWLAEWRERLAREPTSPAQTAEAMRRANPAYIPRNHLVEAALEAATRNDLAPFERLLEVLHDPFTERSGYAEFLLPPDAPDPTYRTFCGT